MNLQPACVEEELEQGEDGDVEVKVVTLVALAGVQELSTNQTHQEEAVNCQGNDLANRGEWREGGRVRVKLRLRIEPLYWFIFSSHTFIKEVISYLS